MDKIGFVGLGIMGKPMCHNLLKAGFDVTFYARRDEIVAEMEARGRLMCLRHRRWARQRILLLRL